MTENNIKSSIEIITPKMAQEYLDSQIQNRKWRRDIVNKYKNEMLAGTWTLNGQPIIFNIKGQLIDGQHPAEPRMKRCMRGKTNDKRTDGNVNNNIKSLGVIRDICNPPFFYMEML